MKTKHAPRPRWFAEAQIPGTAEPTTFEAFGEDAARAMCDLHGWEFLRAWQEGGHSDRPEQAEPNRTVTPRQMKALIVEAKTTYDIHCSVMDDEMPPFDEWRSQQIEFAAKVKSFRDIPAKLYNRVKNHFRTLRGAPQTGNPNTHRKQTGEAGDTFEKRQHIMYLIANEMGHHARRVEKPQTVMEEKIAAIANAKGGAIAVPYLVKIAAAKNKGHTIRDLDDLVKLPVSRLEQLLYTIRNRIAAREGRGDGKNRNKGNQ